MHFVITFPIDTNFTCPLEITILLHLLVSTVSVLDQPLFKFKGILAVHHRAPPCAGRITLHFTQSAWLLLRQQFAAGFLFPQWNPHSIADQLNEAHIVVPDQQPPERTNSELLWRFKQLGRNLHG